MKRGSAYLCSNLIFMALFLLNACSGTQSTAVWKDETYTGGYIRKVMIIGVTESLERRRMFEDEFVKQFKSRGVEAAASYRLISDPETPEAGAVRRKAEQLGADAVFVTHLLGIEERREMYPVTSYGAVGDPRFGAYYPSIADRVSVPRRESTHELVKLESNLYDAGTEKLIWSMKSESFDPKSINDVVHSLGSVALKSLRDNKLIP